MHEDGNVIQNSMFTSMKGGKNLDKLDNFHQVVVLGVFVVMVKG